MARHHRCAMLVWCSHNGFACLRARDVWRVRSHLNSDAHRAHCVNRKPVNSLQHYSIFNAQFVRTVDTRLSSLGRLIRSEIGAKICVLMLILNCSICLIEYKIIFRMPYMPYESRVNRRTCRSFRIFYSIELGPTLDSKRIRILIDVCGDDKFRHSIVFETIWINKNAKNIWVRHSIQICM